MSRDEPLVTVLTPVYNNADYIAECIESVLAQSYQNWEYIIVNNCSTDGTLDVAQRYAAKDSRIRIHNNETFLGIEANLNHAARQISSESRYTKYIFGDDWMFPRCIEEMVAVAEQHPSVGLVACYGLDGLRVVWQGLPYPSTFMTGRDVCRKFFIDHIYAFGTGTSLLYRSDVIRANDPLLDETNPNSDTDSCVSLMRKHDFGFVHQVLVFTRQQPGSNRERSFDMNGLLSARLIELTMYGAHFLSREELDACIERRLREYYNFLAVSVMRGQRDPKFWRLHLGTLHKSGQEFSRMRLARALIARILRAVFNPVETLEKLGVVRAPERGSA